MRATGCGRRDRSVMISGGAALEGGAGFGEGLACASAPGFSAGGCGACAPGGRMVSVRTLVCAKALAPAIASNASAVMATWLLRANTIGDAAFD